MKFYSKIRVQNEAVSVDFDAHELVAIAQKLIAELDLEPVDIPDINEYDKRFQQLIDNEETIPKAEFHLQLDKLLFVPIAIEGIKSSRQWHAVAKALAQAAESQPLRGWWVVIAHRLVNVKNVSSECRLTCRSDANRTEINQWMQEHNLREHFCLYPQNERWIVVGECNQGTVGKMDITEAIHKVCPGFQTEHFAQFEQRLLSVVLEKMGYNKQFYVSDHGHFGEVIRNTYERCCATPWLSNPDIIDDATDMLALSKMFSPNSPKRTALIQKIKQDLATRTDEELQIIFPKATPDFLTRVRQQGFAQEMLLMVDNFSQYTLNTLVKKAREIGAYEEYEKLCAQSPLKREYAEKIIQRGVLSEVAREVNQGKHEPLIRPVGAYGKCYTGDTYPRFEWAITLQQQSSKALSDVDLAKAMRACLFDDSEQTYPAFLPNLTAAWFIGEAARNPSSILMSMVLLDLIENQVPGVNWQHCLLNPQKKCPDKNKKIPNAYGKNTPPDKLGGLHPMVHQGSFEQGRRELKEGELLSIVHQKEANCLSMWLQAFSGQFDDKFTVTAIATDIEPMNTKPSYGELADNLSARRTLYSEKIATLEKRIRLVKSTKPDAQCRKENVKLAKLKAEQLALADPRLINKVKLQRDFIEPMLKQRLQSLVNVNALGRAFIPSVDTATYTSRKMTLSQ